LVLLDEQGLSRASLAHRLALEPGFQIVGECSAAAEAADALSRSAVDVVLLDFNIGPETAADLIVAARNTGYQGQFLLIAGTVDVESSALVLKLGASGIFLKSGPPERLIKAIRLVAGGETWIDREVIGLLAECCSDQPARRPHRQGKDLSDRERRVVSGILDGLTNQRIAREMGLSEGSVKSILQGLFSRTGVHSRSQLVRLAIEGALANAAPALRCHPSAPAPMESPIHR
jgi:two-component system nitrate/nitrite response regulator NarL